MTTVTASELARNLRAVLDRLEHDGEEIVVVRNKHPIARIIPGTPYRTALEAMADLHRVIAPDAAEGWVEEGRHPATLADELDDAWDT